MKRSQFLGFAIFLMISAPAMAQTPAASFEQLLAGGGLQPRQDVYVTDSWGHRTRGRVGELRPGTLVLTQGSRQTPIAEANVTRIQRADSIQDGLWVGLGAGIAAAWMAPHGFCDLPDDECAGIVFAAIGLPSIATGTVAGALIDAAVKKTVFQSVRTGSSARFLVAPAIGGRGAGLRAALRF